MMTHARRVLLALAVVLTSGGAPAAMTVSAVITSGPAPTPMVLHQESLTGLTAVVHEPPSPNQEIQITGPLWTWEVVSVEQSAAQVPWYW